MGLHKDYTELDLHVPGYTQSGDPGAVGAGKLWFDTSGGTGEWLTKIRNDADDGWEIVDRSSAFKIPHYSKGSGDFYFILQPIRVFVTGPEDAWSIQITPAMVIKSLQGGVASPSYTFMIRRLDGIYETTNADPTVPYITLTPDDVGTTIVYVTVDDGTNWPAEVDIYVDLAGPLSGGP